jgi:hypothetical protein
MKYGLIFWGRDRESVKAFCIQKKFILLISSVKPHDSCIHIFMEYGILTVASLYIFEALCSIKKFKGNLKHDFHFHGYNTRGKINLHKQSYCSGRCQRILFSHCWQAWVRDRANMENRREGFPEQRNCVGLDVFVLDSLKKLKNVSNLGLLERSGVCT